MRNWPLKKMGTMVTIDRSRAHDYLFICFVVEKFKNRFEADGAAELNNLLQERAKLTKEQAFAFVSDAIREGYLACRKQDGKRILEVVDEKYNRLRDSYIALIPEIQSAVAGPIWKLQSGLRFQLNDEEKKSLQKFIAQNRVKGESMDMGSIIKQAAKEKSPVQTISQEPQPQVANEDPFLREEFKAIVGPAFMDFIKKNKHLDFSLVVEKKGDQVVTHFANVQAREQDVKWEWQ